MDSTHRASADVMKAALMILTGLGMTAVIGCSASEEMMQQHAQQMAEKDQQMDSMRTENTGVRQRMIKLEQDNKNLEARLSESEMKVMTERDRADKAEAALRSTPPAKPVPPVKEVSKEMPKEGAKEAPKSSAEASGGYQEALELVKARKFDEAISKFESLLTGGIGNDLADNCHYWMGEANYAKKQYQEAIKHFEMVMNYQKSEKTGDAHYMMAQSYERLGDKAKAKSEYETVVKDFPTSSRVQTAKERAAKL
jgi:tol-pal system protein YbgF